MKILDLSMLLFFPADTGGKAGIFHRIIGLAHEHDVCAVIVNSENDIIKLNNEFNIPQNMRIYINSAVTKPINETNSIEKMLQTIKWLISNKPRMACKISDSNLRRKITKIVNEYKPDLIYLESPFVYELLNWNQIDRKKTKVINVVHNQEVEFFKAANNWPLILKNIEIDRIKKYERYIMRFSDGVNCVAPEDALYGQDIVGDKCRYVPSYLAKSEKKWSFKSATEKYIYYSGSLSFNPNLEGLLWFLNNIYSKYITNYADVSLKITGRVNEKIKKELSKYKQVEFTGYLSDEELEDIICNSVFTVVPVLSGGGVKMKMIEAMKYGVPAISTVHVRNGIALSKKANVPFLYTDDPLKFVEYMNLLTENSEIRKNIARQECNYFEEIYSSKNNLEKWVV